MGIAPDLPLEAGFDAEGQPCLAAAVGRILVTQVVVAKMLMESCRLAWVNARPAIPQNVPSGRSSESAGPGVAWADAILLAYWGHALGGRTGPRSRETKTPQALLIGHLPQSLLRMGLCQHSTGNGSVSRKDRQNSTATRWGKRGLLQHPGLAILVVQ